MKSRPPLAVCVLLSLAPGFARAELASGFDVDVESWRATGGIVGLSHQATGGATGGYLRGQATGGDWSFVSPESWAGDWSGYQVIRFQLAIPSGHYPDEETGGILTIHGANGEAMTWTGPTPLWSWTRYEITLSPVAFGVSREIFDAILADVSELRIKGEYRATVNESVGLDEVEITASPVAVFSANLTERFGNAVVAGTRVNGWSPVDDCTLSKDETGFPLHSLKAADWRDGRNFKVASPPSWSGDWRAFTELRFDMRWTSDVADASSAGDELVTIFGANGGRITWSRPLSRNVWTRVLVPLEAAEFGVDQETFDAVMSHVSQVWIRGEFNNGLDQLWLDNVVASIGPEARAGFPHGLHASFDADSDGWFGYENGAIGWTPDGFTGGAASLTDTGSGLAKFSSPDSWAGDWSNFRTLRFMLSPERLLGEPNANPVVAVHGLNNVVISTSPGRPMRTWTPYTLDLTPATFGVTREVFDSVMGNVAQLTIMGDLVAGTDTTLLDALKLDPAGSPEPNPPERLSTFASGNEGWRKGGRDGNLSNPTWGFLGTAVAHGTTEGNPPGSITINDEYNIAYWFSPESWAGDWRGHREISFDLKIVTGTSLLDAGDMLRIFSPHGTLTRNITAAELPVPGQWRGYSFALGAADFGVTEAVYQRIMRDVFMIGIRSEWISGAETEALDNVRVTKGDPDYWAWAETHFNGDQMPLAGIAGRAADADGDGIPNFDEFLFLTSPADPASRFAPVLETAAGGGLSLRFPTHAGRRYWIEQSTDLGLGDPWTRVGDEVPGDGDVLILGAPFNGMGGFLRVGVSRQP